MNFGIIGQSSHGNKQNIMFEDSFPSHANDLGYPFRVLREKLHLNGHNLDTIDMRPLESFDGFIFVEIPPHDTLFRRIIALNKPLYAIVFECPVIMPSSWRMETHYYFDKIFTWDASLSGERYVLFHWPNNFSEPVRTVPFDARKRLVCIFATRKWSTHPLELYSERLRAIDWFNQYHHEEMDLFGWGWSPSVRKKTKEFLLNMVRDIKGCKKSPWSWTKYRVHKGYAERKLETMRDYKFSICYENAREIPGYITEKIFDCFLAGVVPVYLGWSGVEKFIPRECYVDKKEFGDYESLYRYISSMEESEYNGYLAAINKFLQGPQSDLFDANAFAEIVATAITGSSRA